MVLMFKQYRDKLFCFSPPVMLATFVIEIVLAVYAVVKYKMTTVVRIAVLILVALASFQLSEYMICGGLGWTYADWAKYGYIAITLLPPLGIHLLMAIAKKKQSALLISAYATCAIFVAFYIFNPNAINGQACYPNYAVFYTNTELAHWFTAYYYGWLFVGIYLALHWGIGKPKKRKALHWLMIGYLTFLLPTIFFNLINPSTIRAIPSIMCGFAVLLAVIIVAFVLPGSGVSLRKSK